MHVYVPMNPEYRRGMDAAVLVRRFDSTPNLDILHMTSDQFRSGFFTTWQELTGEVLS